MNRSFSWILATAAFAFSASALACGMGGGQHGGPGMHGMHGMMHGQGGGMHAMMHGQGGSMGQGCHCTQGQGMAGQTEEIATAEQADPHGGHDHAAAQTPAQQ